MDRLRTLPANVAGARIDRSIFTTQKFIGPPAAASYCAFHSAGRSRRTMLVFRASSTSRRGI
jgi:hypothetical protein